jgi:hypothetical protein
MPDQQQWITRYSDYIREYILDFNTGPKANRKHIPGEHHFVSMYLVPRLVGIPFLGLPTYVNPDGMKAIPGDIVYYDREEDDSRVNWNFRMGIEVKIGSVIFSRTEYNDWMRPEISEVPKPHLFVGIAQQGILIGRWEAFAERFRKTVYPGDTAPQQLDPSSKADRYTLTRELPKIVHDTEEVLCESERPLPQNLRWWDYSDNETEAAHRESEVMAYLERECREILGEEQAAETASSAEGVV